MTSPFHSDGVRHVLMAVGILIPLLIGMAALYGRLCVVEVEVRYLVNQVASIDAKMDGLMAAGVAGK
jgi:hypothetical protein